LKIVKVLMAAACALVLGPALGLAQIQTGHFATDAEMLEVLSDTLFVAEGRIGDRGGAATFELDLGYSTSAPNTTTQYNWISGQTEPFTLSYDPLTSLVTFSLGGKLLSYTTAFDDFGVIFVRTRAIDDGAAVSVVDLLLGSQPVGGLSAAAGPGGLDILWITGPDLSLGFALTGVATLSWGSPVPSQSRLAFQVKVARLTTVAAEPQSWGQIKNLYR
jgi:hypothetical protein